MSHFLTLVLVDVPGLRPEELRRRPRVVRAQLDRLLAPYDENTAVTPYEDRCLAFSFPYSPSAATIEVVVGTVGLGL